MVNETENTRIVMRSDKTPTTLRVVGDVGSVLRASCIWEPATSGSPQRGNISTIRLPDARMRFGLGAVAFDPSPELAIQRLGECALIEGIPWWIPAERPSTSR